MTIEHKFFTVPTARNEAAAEIDRLVDEGWSLKQFFPSGDQNGGAPQALMYRHVEPEPEVDRTVPDDDEYRQAVKDALRPGVLGEVRRAVENASAQDLADAQASVNEAWAELEVAIDALGLKIGTGNVIAVLVAVTPKAEDDEEDEDEEDEDDDEDGDDEDDDEDEDDEDDDR